jgi:uracil DNA glycosylase superfamily protein
VPSDEEVTVPITDLTKEFMRCARCFEQGHEVGGLSPLWPPRGWAGPDTLTPPVLLVVSMNPGHPLQLAPQHGAGWDELALLRRHHLLGDVLVDGGEVVVRRRLAVTTQAARDVAAFCWKSYDTPTGARDHTFHRRSVAYARACLWLLGAEGDEWREHCWFTDAVKCSTSVETNVGVPDGAVTECRRHLVREIDMIRPAVILALGGDAKRAVDAATVGGKVKPRVVQFLHPARWRKLTSDRQMLGFSTSGLTAGPRTPDSPQFRSYLAQLQAELERKP